MADETTMSYKYAYGTSYLVLGLLGLAGNLVETIVIQRRSRKTSFGAIVASLSIADGISGILFTTIGIGIILFTSGVANFQLVHYGVIGLNFSVLASLNHVILSVMYRAIAAFNKEQVADNWIAFGLLFVLVWGSACLYGVVSVLVLKSFISVNSKIILVYTSITMLLYVPILCKRAQVCADLGDSQYEARRAQGGKMLLHSVLLTACSFACYLPFAINTLRQNPGVVSGTVCDLLIAMNPILDALIYFYVNRKEKKMELAQKASSEPLVSVTHV